MLLRNLRQENHGSELLGLKSDFKASLSNLSIYIVSNSNKIDMERPSNRLWRIKKNKERQRFNSDYFGEGRAVGSRKRCGKTLSK